jgi:hypothetical protein
VLSVRAALSCSPRASHRVLSPPNRAHTVVHCDDVAYHTQWCDTADDTREGVTEQDVAPRLAAAEERRYARERTRARDTHDTRMDARAHARA